MAELKVQRAVAEEDKNMYIFLSVAAFIVLVTLLDTHYDQQRKNRTR
jgi:hypothetical protein